MLAHCNYTLSRNWLLLLRKWNSRRTVTIYRKPDKKKEYGQLTVYHTWNILVLGVDRGQLSNKSRRRRLASFVQLGCVIKTWIAIVKATLYSPPWLFFALEYFSSFFSSLILCLSAFSLSFSFFSSSLILIIRRFSVLVRTAPLFFHVSLGVVLVVGESSKTSTRCVPHEPWRPCIDLGAWMVLHRVKDNMRMKQNHYNKSVLRECYTKECKQFHWLVEFFQAQNLTQEAFVQMDRFQWP